MSVEFSIIVPIYNVHTYMEQATRSVTAQEYTDYEIILVDDGSTDGSYELCENLAHKNEKLKVIHQKNAGLSQARNTGIRAAAGRYIVFLDGDDMLTPNALNDLHECIKKYAEPDIIVHRRKTFTDGKSDFQECAYTFDEKSFSQMPMPALYRQLQTLPDCWLGAWLFTAKTSYLKSKNLYFYPGILHEDEEWVPRALLNAHTIGFNNTCFYCNRIDRAGSICATPNIKRLQDKMLIVDLLEQEFTSGAYSKEVQEVFYQRRCQIVFGVLCDLYAYFNAPEIGTVLSALERKIKLLSKSEKKPHRIAWCVSKMIGIKNTSVLLNKIKR